MAVRLNLSVLRQTKWYEIVLRFLFGGLATVAAGLIAKSFGPVVGGLFLAFPAIFPATATLVEKHVKEKKRVAGIDGVNSARCAVALEARGATMGSIGLAVFAIVAWQVLFGRPAWLVLTAATLSWLITSLLIWELRRVARGHLLAKNHTTSSAK
jgi:Protein of unknown function (DUF3147)